MNKKMWWKIGLIALVIVVFAVALIPKSKDDEPIPLGLDLKGGTHLVMQVNTIDAVRAEADQAMESAREVFVQQKLPTPALRRIGDQAFIIVPPAGVSATEYEKAGGDALPSYETSATAEGLQFRLKGVQEGTVSDQAVSQAIETIRNRVDALGVTEPIIARQGGPRGTRIVIQLPGVDDPVRVKEIIKTTAQLQFRMVEGVPGSDAQQVYNSLPAALRSEVDVLPGDSRDDFGRLSGVIYYAIRKSVPVTGRDLKTARVVQGSLNEPVIEFALTADGRRKFTSLTGANVGRQLAIVLDKKVQSAPVIKQRISDEKAVIEGRFTPQEASDLSLVLRSGSLPASLTTLEERTVGPSLGRDSIREGVTASVIGFALVIVAVLVYYRGAGVNALVALVLNLLILLGMMSYFKATLTLPGIAGIILTLAMAIDSNVLVFERIREELRAGKSIRTAIDTGFSLAFGTIIDTHLTTIIAALFLFQFGSGPVKGFAVTLLIGLAASVFTAFFVSRVIFDLMYNRANRPETISI